MASKSSNAKSQSLPGAPAPAGPLDVTVRMFSRFQRFAWDIAGVVVIAFTLMTSLALLFPHLTGGMLFSWANLVLQWLGWGSAWLVSFGLIAGIWMLRRYGRPEPPRIAWGRVIALETAAFCSLALLSALGGTSLSRADAGLDGGRVGWGLSSLLDLVLGLVGLGGPFWQILLLTFVSGIALVAGLGLLSPLGALFERLARELEQAPAVSVPAPHASPAVPPGPAVSEAPLPGQEKVTVEAGQRKKAPFIPEQFRKNFRLPQPAQAVTAPPPVRDERLPPFDLLINEKAGRPDERHINQTAGLIEKTLSEFGIPAKVVGFRIGPTVTQFAVVPGYLEKEKPGTDDLARQKIRVAQISALQRDLTLALAAQRLRIEAPVPGRPYVGIEVPNSKSTVVRMRPVMETDAFFKVNAPLTIALGQDVSGQPVVADLSRMPHLLVAGTTGSGKSVCIAALTTCLVMNNTPEDLRLIMVDPKMVELVRFNGLPHLLGKVETDIERILGVLRWTAAEMDRRYKLLENVRARNIDSYNKKIGRKKGAEPLPRLVLMIDELADLMMTAPEQTEHNLVRLAQMARAVGIHLVVATQRPSTDVVTGLIKANFPARISFAVASSIDSRVILDTGGAEALLGRGDMLFLPPEAPAPVRAQGVLVTDQEIERIIHFWQKASPPQEKDGLTPWDQMLEEEAVLADRDDLIRQAVNIVRETQRASASMLQRRLKIGYPRAARLVDELEELGVVGPNQGGGREREVLLGPGDESPFVNVGGEDDEE